MVTTRVPYGVRQLVGGTRRSTAAWQAVRAHRRWSTTRRRRLFGFGDPCRAAIVTTDEDDVDTRIPVVRGERTALSVPWFADGDVDLFADPACELGFENVARLGRLDGSTHEREHAGRMVLGRRAFDEEVLTVTMDRSLDVHEVPMVARHGFGSNARRASAVRSATGSVSRHSIRWAE